MEMKIMFLILALLGLYLIFTSTGQEWLQRYVGIRITPKG